MSEQKGTKSPDTRIIIKPLFSLFVVIKELFQGQRKPGSNHISVDFRATKPHAKGKATGSQLVRIQKATDTACRLYVTLTFQVSPQIDSVPRAVKRIN